MSTKVKGDKIKEGSIPLSALATEVKDKIENAGGSADWNAQEGEAGYIENRTHYVEIFNGEITDEGILYDLGDVDVIKNGCVIELIYDGYSKIFKPGVKESWTTDWSGVTNIVVSYNGNALMSITEEYGDDSYYEDMLNSIVCYTPTKQLNEAYLPDTVLKTTPQTLSDTDKNQALTNLGIDAYIKNFNKKFYLDVAYDEITLNGDLVVDYSGGVDNLIDNIKTFIANCVCYNQTGFTIISGLKLACTYMSTNGGMSSAAAGNMTISDYKNSITNGNIIFGFYDFETVIASTIISLGFDDSGLYYTLREL